mgnify:CR=1 FL=1
MPRPPAKPLRFVTAQRFVWLQASTRTVYDRYVRLFAYFLWGYAWIDMWAIPEDQHIKIEFDLFR